MQHIKMCGATVKTVLRGKFIALKLILEKHENLISFKPEKVKKKKKVKQ